MPAVNIGADELNALLGEGIARICQRGFDDADDNHCAHFVSHVLGYQFGYTCANAVAGPGRSAGIRVAELFPECPEVGRWRDRPSTLEMGLVFITHPGNVNLQNKTIANVPKKHVGIFIGDEIWHYSNTRDEVVRQTSDQFSRHYDPPHNAMFYGSLP